MFHSVFFTLYFQQKQARKPLKLHLFKTMTHTPNHHSLSIIENTSYLNESSIPHHHAFDPPPPRIVSTAGCCPDYPAVAPQVHINLTTLISLNILLVTGTGYNSKQSEQTYIN